MKGSEVNNRIENLFNWVEFLHPVAGYQALIEFKSNPNWVVFNDGLSCSPESFMSYDSSRTFINGKEQGKYPYNFLAPKTRIVRKEDLRKDIHLFVNNPYGIPFHMEITLPNWKELFESINENQSHFHSESEDGFRKEGWTTHVLTPFQRLLMTAEGKKAYESMLKERKKWFLNHKSIYIDLLKIKKELK